MTVFRMDDKGTWIVKENREPSFWGRILRVDGEGQLLQMIVR